MFFFSSKIENKGVGGGGPIWVSRNMFKTKNQYFLCKTGVCTPFKNKYNLHLLYTTKPHFDPISYLAKSFLTLVREGMGGGVEFVL